ncbi:MAG: ABC transporter substrate binding protein [Burkholderiales bacterium]
MSKVARVGILTPAAPEPVGMRFVDAFRQGMRERGWEEGRNLIIESRFAHGRYERLGELATELARLNVDAFVIDSTPAARAVMNAAPTVPIVMALVGDPVRTGLVPSLARPGGNVTGMTLMSAELSRNDWNSSRRSFQRQGESL